MTDDMTHDPDEGHTDCAAVIAEVSRDYVTAARVSGAGTLRLMFREVLPNCAAPLIVQEIFRILRRINEEEKVSMLLVEQNAALALELADRVYLLETGKVVTSGTAATIRDDETLRKAYLGY